ncbi:MAG: hypothetical protein NT166_10860 [Candidatus Aminicenantes bacterium]|nr:hypothetical protein [Candidatus Aminicenantes bacterium]
MAELEIRAYVNHLGIREAAQKKTINLLTRFLNYMGYKEVNIQFPEDVKQKPLFNISDTDIVSLINEFDVNQTGGGK